MLAIILSAWALVALTMTIHTAGIAVLLRRLIKLDAPAPTRLFPIATKVFRMIWWLILVHLVEISVWGLFYLWRGCLPDAQTAFYFSGTSYTTIGYGDVVLAKPWRLLGPIEGLVGILMCSLSTGYFFVVVNHIFQSRYGTTAAVATIKKTQT